MLNLVSSFSDLGESEVIFAFRWWYVQPINAVLPKGTSSALSSGLLLLPVLEFLETIYQVASALHLPATGRKWTDAYQRGKMLFSISSKDQVMAVVW